MGVGSRDRRGRTLRTTRGLLPDLSGERDFTDDRLADVLRWLSDDECWEAIETLDGLYAGNPKRRTARPTTERPLKAFRGITPTVVQLPDQVIRHVTPLSGLQRRILALLVLPGSIYENLTLPVQPIPP